ncbi:MAG: SH3 domain-containing protein [Bdellovibrionota bacterium]
MGSKRAILGITGGTCLFGVAVLGHVLFPSRGKTLADWTPLSRPKIATAQVAGEAHATVTDEADDDLAHGRALAQQNLERARAAQRQVETVVGQQVDTNETVQRLTEEKKSLETQQESLVREMLALKKQLREVTERADRAESESADRQKRAQAGNVSARTELEEQLQQERAKNEKEHSNLKLLADHIMKLRQELKDKTAEIAEKEGEISTLRQQQTASQREVAASFEAERTTLTQDKKKAEQERDELVTRLEEARKKIDEQEQSIGSLRESIQKLESEKRGADEKLTHAHDDLSGQGEELENTQRQLSKTIEEARACSESLEQKTKAAENLPGLQKDLDEARAAVTDREKQIADLKTQVGDREQLVSNIALLKRELLAAKNQLALKEKESQLLGTPGAKKPGTELTPEMQAARDRILEQGGRNAGLESMGRKPATINPAGNPAGPAPTGDVMVVEVIAKRVALRNGPSPDDSELMPVGKGTTLTVEERSGDWYRVIAPNDMRAWIRADMVRVVSGPRSGAASGISADPGDAPVSRPSAASRAPKKRPLKALEDDPNMEPFGEVKKDKEDRAFDAVKQGIGRPESDKPSTPDMLP